MFARLKDRLYTPRLIRPTTGLWHLKVSCFSYRMVVAHPRVGRLQLTNRINLCQGWQGGLIRLKKAGLNRMDKTGFFQTIFEKIRFKARWAPPKDPQKKSC